MKIAEDNSLPAQILKAVALGALLCVVLSSPSGTRRFLKGIKKEWNRYAAYQAVRRLKKRRLIHFERQEDGSLKVVLTKLGLKKVKIFQSGELEFSKRREDGRWRVILFDIPEEHKQAREVLRRKFRQWGFFRLQRSAYLCRYRCEEEVEMLRELLEIDPRYLAVLALHKLPPEFIPADRPV